MLRRNNKIEDLVHGGPVLGPNPDATYMRGFVKLEQGDLVCLYSDGIVEAHNKKDEEYGLVRLQRNVKSNRDRGLNSEQIGREVLERVARWGRKGEDDRTVVIVRAIG